MQLTRACVPIQDFSQKLTVFYVSVISVVLVSTRIPFLKRMLAKSMINQNLFLVKLWTTKTVRKDDGNAQSFLHWNFE